jgi:AAA domain
LLCEKSQNVGSNRRSRARVSYPIT